MPKHLSRRRFGKTVGAATLAGSTLPAVTGGIASLIGEHAQAQGSPQVGFYSFPSSFRWGCATAAYQVEGGVNEGGRGKSIWDTFSHTPGKIYENQNGDVADDYYHRYKEDIGRLKDLGAKIYRFSISWPRIFPEGTGKPNEQGVAYYEQVVDAVLAAGIEPFATLFHWDLPQTLQDQYGGWESRKTAEAFANYAGYVASRLSDRVQRFFTMNEFSSFIDLGYRTGQFAPGLKLTPKALNQTRFNAVLAHGLAVQAIRAKGKPGTKVGLAENFASGVPVFNSEEHIKASAQATRILNAAYLTVIMEGKYPEEYLREQGPNAPQFTEEDLKVIGSPLDLIGANIYTPTFIRADDSKLGFAVVPMPESYPHMASPWLYIGPEALYWAPRHLAEIWNVKDIYITENGCSSSDVLTPSGHVYDTDRVMYLRNYLINLHRAAVEGYPVHGYFLWSLLDNFEWADGYSKRFGIYYIDFTTQKRYPKLSAHFYKDVIANNAVM